ncbi:VWA domain-containing protein [Streptomyces sp. NPDC001407]|uniref:VWA domain-containing protein n=1 Tax=unclassified Streptomyces TaxID=2593676 RepID=UPI00367FB298
MNRANGAAGAGRPALSALMGQNWYLPAGSGTVPAHAILTVEAGGMRPLARRAESAEVIVIDCSGSMNSPSTKIAAARRAAAAAVDVLRDGTRFALVEGTAQARVVYPGPGRMAVAGPDSRADAAHVAAGLVAAGGTAIASWLDCAHGLLAAEDAPIRHALLLTDGRNEHDRPGELERVLSACAGRFRCDARGIGEAWAATELREIAARLHGVADAVEHDSDLEAEFRTMMTSAMAKALPDVRIRVSLRDGSELRFVKQVFPTELDLTAEGVRTDSRTWEFPTGAWGDESRDFHLCVTADPDGDPPGEELQLALVTLVAAGTDAAQAPVALPDPCQLKVVWTDDRALSTRIHPRVAHYDGHAELGRSVVAGCEAYERGEPDAAEAAWGRAVRLAHELRDEKTLRRLQRLVTVTDAARGEVRVRPGLSTGDLNAAWVTADHSTLWTEEAQPAPPPREAPDLVCPRCSRRSAAGANVCTECGHRFAPPPAGPTA